MVGTHTIVTIGVIASKDGGVTSHHVYGFNWVGFMSQFSAAAAYNNTCPATHRAARSSATYSPEPRLQPSD